LTATPLPVDRINDSRRAFWYIDEQHPDQMGAAVATVADYRHRNNPMRFGPQRILGL
jgi:hypothetical protein